MIVITFPDGSTRNFESGTSAMAVAASIGKRLASDAVAAILDGELVDLSANVQRDCSIEFVTLSSKQGMEVLWHSSAHIMAQAVKELFPEVLVTIGPSIDRGFYYDFDKSVPFTPEDFAQIESRFAEIVKADLPFVREVVSREDALVYFGSRGESYKVELIEGLAEGTEISIYTQGGFTDLCRGPHLPTTGRPKAFKIMSNAGAYWRGDETQKMLQRLYAISFASQAELKEYLTLLEEAKKRDHRKLGRELGLVAFFPEAAGMAFWLPKGLKVFNGLVDYWRAEHDKAGYTEIKTPSMLNVDLWKKSGHWDHYHENMYTVDGGDVQYALKPMDCPDSILVYNLSKRSYRDLPLRFNELGHLHRNEITGALNGLFRLREFTQDDAHNFIRPDQIESEIGECIGLVDRAYGLFGLDYHIFLSTRPEDFLGSVEVWDEAEESLRRAIGANGKEFSVNEGEGAFYGPKLDFMVTDALRREWQLATIQLDFQLPSRFDCTYTDADGTEKQPVLIHRVVFGAIERFIGIIIEHFAGKFPLWLAPTQVTVIAVADAFNEHAQKVAADLRLSHIRVDVDDRNEKVGYKIRQAEVQKCPYIVVLGEKEVENGGVAVRAHGGKDLGTMPLADFRSLLLGKIETRSLD